MYLYNSVSHKKELFTPNKPELVKMYTCGPTVYHYAHIGNRVPTSWRMCWKNPCGILAIMSSVL